MMVAWPVAWAPWLELVVAVGVSAACAVGAVVFLGGMVKDETVSSRLDKWKYQFKYTVTW